MKKLKCWKKTSEVPFNFAQYEKSDGKRIILQNQDPTWKVSVNGKKLKVLKSKALAEKFAKKYMKEHDKC